MDLRAILEDQNPWWREPAIRPARLHPFRRPAEQRVLDFVTEDNRSALLILGPRQVGKTVLLYQLIDDLLARERPATSVAYFDFSDARISRPLIAQEVLDALPPPSAPWPRILLLDEISQSTNWDRWLKNTVDRRLFEESVTRIVATDSAASALAHGGRESGLGRWDELHLEGLTFQEFLGLNSAGESVSSPTTLGAAAVERYLALGGFPGYALLEPSGGVRARLRESVVVRAIERDLARYGLEIDRGRALFTYLAANSGDVWNLQDRANDLQADRRTVADWLRRLKDTALLVALDQATGGKPSARPRARPKIYAADHGLINAFAVSPLQAPDVRPKVFEAVVFRHLREQFSDPLDRLTYFRFKEQVEIDFVVESGGRKFGVEVTSTSTLKPERRAKLRKAAGLLDLAWISLVHDGVAAEPAKAVGDPALQLLSLPAFLRDPGRICEGPPDA